MILSVKKSNYDAIKAGLDPEDRVVVLSCNNCAKKCLGLGGRAGLASLAGKLEADGFEVHRELIGFACSIDLVGKRGKEAATREAFERADVILTLACEDGEAAVRAAFPEARVPGLNKTLGIGWGSPSTGVRLTHCVAGVELEIDLPEGIPLAEAAQKLGCETGSY